MSKLVRDRIPDLIRFKEGKFPDFDAVTKEPEIRNLLMEKLQEEVDEAREGLTIEELADIQEVCYGLARVIGYTDEELDLVRVGKRTARGGFGIRMHNGDIKGYVLHDRN